MSPVDRLSRRGEDVNLEKCGAFHSKISRIESRVPKMRKDVNLDEEKIEEGHDGMARPDSR
jgi:hypothetical protein